MWLLTQNVERLLWWCITALLFHAKHGLWVFSIKFAWPLPAPFISCHWYVYDMATRQGHLSSEHFIGDANPCYTCPEMPNKQMLVSSFIGCCDICSSPVNTSPLALPPAQGSRAIWPLKPYAHLHDLYSMATVVNEESGACQLRPNAVNRKMSFIIPEYMSRIIFKLSICHIA